MELRFKSRFFFFITHRIIEKLDDIINSKWKSFRISRPRSMQTTERVRSQGGNEKCLPRHCDPEVLSLVPNIHSVVASCYLVAPAVFHGSVKNYP